MATGRRVKQLPLADIRVRCRVCKRLVTEKEMHPEKMLFGNLCMACWLDMPGAIPENWE